MKQLLVLAAVSALALAKPELYKEQEDFQYSRSSTDEGSKSGFYGAQRGNMGGNYERAHNMDFLAQNQMSGLVRQVEGELGDGANTRTGHVYSSANSKGIYGSGHFDLSNLAGRNFHEGTYHDSSQSHSSLSKMSSAQSSANYANRNSNSYSNSRYRGYHGSDAQTQTDDLHSLDNLQGSDQYYNHGRHSSGFNSQAGFHEHGEYDHSNTNSNSGVRIISATPVKVILTPGGRVAIPVATQTHDATHGYSAFDQNAQNSNSLSVSDDNQGYIPSNAKHYESSYRYHKKWEKHDTIPTGFSIVPVTEDPIPKNSELLEDREAHLQHNYDTRGLDSQNEHSSSASGSYSGVKSSSSQSRYQSKYHGGSSNSNANLYNQFRYQARANNDDISHSSLNANSHLGEVSSNSELNSQVENLNTKPKSYQSSYSYHKSWERQGDPYVIKPASAVYYDSQGQRLTNNQGYAHTGSHYSQNQADCDENGHIRIARSSYTDNKNMQQQNQYLDDPNELTQQIQSTGQYSDDLNQQSRTEWDQHNLGQQSQNKWETLEDLNQQGQQSLNQENVEQQSQNTWNNLEDLNQQPQSNLELQNSGQPQTQWNNLEETGQQSQKNLEQQNVGQESQNQWDTFENLGYQSNKNWGEQSLDQNTFDDITQQQQTSDINSDSLKKYLQNFRGEHSQDNEHQKTQQSLVNKTATALDAPAQELDDKVPHKVETPWDKFDIHDANKEIKTTTEHNVEISEFYWHHIPNNGIEDQHINKLSANGDIISELGHRNLNSRPILEQADEYVGFDNNYNPNVPYIYSNGFVNPTINNKRNFNPQYENSHQVNNGNAHSWIAEGHKNLDSQVSWQEHATESNVFSQESKISSLWNKFDTIEKESHFSTSNLEYVPKQGENNFSSSNAYQDGETTSARTYILQTDKPLNISSDNQYRPQKESQTVSSNAYEHSVSDIELPEEIESLDNNNPETPQDSGRGDIGADDSFSHSDTVSSPHDIPDNSDNTKLNVLSLEPQKVTKEQYNKTNISDEIHKNDARGLSNTNKSQNVSEDTSDTIQNNKFGNNFKEVSQQATKLTDMETSEEDRVNLQKDGLNFQSSQPSLDSTQQSVNKEYNLNNFEFQNAQEFINHQTNFDQQASHNIEQEHRQDFGQQNHDLEQQNLHYFEQQNVKDFGQQNENVENFQNFEQNVQDFGQQNENVEEQNLQNFEQNVQDFGQQNENVEESNLQNFEQENVQDFAQKNKNLEQQSLYNFGQDNLRGPRHDTDSIEKQTLQKFEKKNLELHQFEQNVQNFEQESENQHSLQQESVRNLWRENEQLTQEHLQAFGQVNIPHFVLQNQNEDQKNYRTIDNENVNLFKLHQLENPKKEIPTEIHQEQFTEHIADQIKEQIGQKQLPNLEHLQPNVTENNLETPKEAVTEKSSFWKSLGNKLSNAKSKVVNWFKS